MATNLLPFGVLIVILAVACVFLYNNQTNSVTTSTTIYQSSTSTPTTTTINAQLPTFSLTGWKVAIRSAHSDAVIAFNYTTTSPVKAYLYTNVTRLINRNYSWSDSDYTYLSHTSLNNTSGSGNLSLTGSPQPGNYVMVAYSVDSYGTPVTAVWHKLFNFSGPHMVLSNASVSWETTGASGVYWYQPTTMTVDITNTGDLPAYGYYLRGWVNSTPIFINTGPYYGWIAVGGPWPANIPYGVGVFQAPGNYPLHVELVKDYNTLAAQWNGQTRIS